MGFFWRFSAVALLLLASAGSAEGRSVSEVTPGSCGATWAFTHGSGRLSRFGTSDSPFVSSLLGFATRPDSRLQNVQINLI